MDLEFMRQTAWELLQGVPLTLQLTIIPVSCGALLACLITYMRLSPFRALKTTARLYVFIIRGTPLLIQIFLIYYGLGQFRVTLQEWGVWLFFREPFWCALLALTLNTGAYGSEIVRGGIDSVPYQQLEAGRAYGMSGLLLMRRVIFPQALRQALPAYGNEIILLLKATSLCSIITMMEVTGIAARLITETFRSLEVFIIAGAIYLTLNFAIENLVALFERIATPETRIKPPIAQQ